MLTQWKLKRQVSLSEPLWFFKSTISSTIIILNAINKAKKTGSKVGFFWLSS